MTKELEITLSEPIKYSKGGELLDESVLLLQSPSTQLPVVRRNARHLKNLSLAAIQKAQDKRPDNVPEPTGETEKEDYKSGEGRGFLNSLGFVGVDTQNIVDAMKLLAPHVVCIGESGEKLKAAHWDRLSMEDEEEITGAYITNFLLNFGDSEPKS